MLLLLRPRLLQMDLETPSNQAVPPPRAQALGAGRLGNGGWVWAEYWEGAAPPGPGQPAGHCAWASVPPHPPSETRPSMLPDHTAAVVALSAVSPQGPKPSLWALQVLCSGVGLLTLSPVLGAIVGVHTSKCQRGRGRWTLGMKEPTEFPTPQNP